MSRFENPDYGDLAKAGFLLGVGLFVIGAGGEVLGHALYGALPAWENTLFVYAEGIGILAALLSPFLFGIALPLIE